jgi:hypothetical protein
VKFLNPEVKKMKKTFIAIFCGILILTTSGVAVFAQQTKTATCSPKTRTSGQTYEELIDRYFDSLNETDGPRRRGLIKQVWTETGVFAYPGQEVKGFAEIDADVEQVQKKYPGALVCRAGKIEVVHDNYVRFNWEFGEPGAKPIITGIDFAVVTGGKLQLVVGFFDFVAPNPAKK